MAPYHIRQYQDGDHQSVVDLFSWGMEEHHHLPPHAGAVPDPLLLLGVPLVLFLASGSLVSGSSVQSYSLCFSVAPCKIHLGKV